MSSLDRLSKWNRTIGSLAAICGPALVLFGDSNNSRAFGLVSVLQLAALTVVIGGISYNVYVWGCARQQGFFGWVIERPAGGRGLRLARRPVSPVLRDLVAAVRSFDRWTRLFVFLLGVSNTLVLGAFLFALLFLGHLGTTTAIGLCGLILLSAVLIAGKAKGLWRLVGPLCPVLAAAGIYVLTGLGQQVADWGLIAGLVVALCYVTWFLIGKWLSNRKLYHEGNAVGSLFSVTFGVVVLGVTTALGDVRWLNPEVILIATESGIATMFVAQLVQATAFKRISTQSFALWACLEPVLGLLIGWLFLGQAITALHWAGITMVAVAAFGATLGDNKVEAAVE